MYHGAGNAWAMQSIIVHKPVTLSTALANAAAITHKPKMSHTETDTAIHFRNLPKTKFVKGAFRSKKVNKSITIVFGQLKPEFENLRGEGIWDWVKDKAKSVVDYFKPRLDGFNNVSTKTLKAFGDKPIRDMYLMRTPIKSTLNTALNLISLGKWNELRQKYAYDKLYHLSLVVEVDNKKLIVEKNATVNINTNYANDADSEIQGVSTNGKNLTVYELVSNARTSVGDTTFFKYNAFNQNGGTNCQKFIQIVLDANGLLSAEANAFLMQDIQELTNELPGYVKDAAQVVTDMGAIANKVTGGKRNAKPRKRS